MKAEKGSWECQLDSARAPSVYTCLPQFCCVWNGRVIAFLQLSGLLGVIISVAAAANMGAAV